MYLPDKECSAPKCPEGDPEEEWRFYVSGLPNYLEARILGQSAAVGRIARAVQAAELGLNERGNRPKCSFLLLGPTGVGKTESAKCFTEYLFGDRDALEMIFMNEYSSNTRLPEFLHRTEAAIRRNPEGGTLLFDEIEKAHPQLIDIFLSLLDEGELTTHAGDRFSASRFYLVLTSNLGSSDLARMENAPYATMERVALDGASQVLRPELFARITERMVFRPLGLDVQKSIIEALIDAKLKVLAEYFGIKLTVDRGPVTAFMLRAGYNKTQGARRLRQEVDRQFNSAALDHALSSVRPAEGRFYYDSTTGCLVLR
ncbi:MAG: ATP-dependent Clp protease ATP-binding subunit [Verrucomicrobia bacterium]|nr:ATP-dependent Clp protease ATP-binding subunit [Verrucomicrobiota bacterium]